MTDSLMFILIFAFSLIFIMTILFLFREIAKLPDHDCNKSCNHSDKGLNQ